MALARQQAKTDHGPKEDPDADPGDPPHDGLGSRYGNPGKGSQGHEETGRDQGNENGEVIFEQADCEIPASWSQLATNVVVSKYFRGHLDTPERESSVKQLIGRVVWRIHEWGAGAGYFRTPADGEVFKAELTHLLVNQQMAFNSPVWFNVGVEPKPQCSACFILSVEDTMDSILDWYRKEGVIFKGGSGSGVNLSRLRSGKERLAGGGMASGPVSFMRAADASAGVIKSGGKTRRAAKMAGQSGRASLRNAR